jgi:hypothetical protein
VRVELTPYSAAAFVVVVALATAAAGVAALIAGWARVLVRAAPGVAAAGLALTGAAVLNLALPRTCSTEPTVRNRPAVSALTGDACQRGALAQVQVVVLLGVATSLAVRVRSRRHVP